MTTYISSLTFPRIVFEQPAVAILLPVVCGAGIGYATRPDQTKATYGRLKQPPFNPPAWLFGPAWTTLYAIMGYTSYRAWTAGANSINPSTVALAKQGATLYTIQLGLNLIWMPLFFGFGKPIAATADIVALTGVVGSMAYVWGQVDPVCAWLLAPYVAWLSFATYLSAGVGYLNDWDLSKASGVDKKKL
ncbi:TspO/MBR-related protein [Pleomassaria siparia CBS 279.74]|uniref:TspO/MBR-related protein n=1 Tax=Pleomassaria siparia CBS 279.74 TaxID=1314801 RepID=A0A6G1JYD1_9PLEO|nr:TspO/MBR-related protein [Pleomassaria siparia CBS 279.74]